MTLELLSIGQIVALCALFIWSGFVRSGFGFGGAALTLPLLLFVVDSPLLVLPVIALHLVFFSSITVGTHFHNVNWPYLKKLVTITLIPKLAGIAGLLSLPDDILSIILYAIMLLYGAMYLSGKKIRSQNRFTDGCLLAMGGYFSGVSLVGAPPIVAVVSRDLPAAQVRETLFVLWLIMVALKLAAFVATGTDLQLMAALWLLPFAGIGHWLGLRFHRRILASGQTSFMRLVGAGLLSVSAAGIAQRLLS